MAAILKEIEAEALRLTPQEREMLAATMLHSLDDAPPSEIDKAWIAEAERRYDDWLAGKTKPIAGEHFFSDLRRELGCE